MRAKINPTGTHVQNGILKVRVDLYPDPADKTYGIHYVTKFDREPTEAELADPSELARVPVHQELNPCLCHFINVPEDITGDQLLDYLEQLFAPDCLATLDEILSQPDALHYVSPYIRSKPKLTTTPIKVKAEDAIKNANTQLSGLEFNGEKGKPESVEPQSIDIGSDAINRNASWGSVTLIAYDNPSNGSGTLDTIEAWCYTNMTGFEVATFYVISGDELATRDYENIGNVTAGSKQTFTGLSIDVATNDYIGMHAATGNIEYSTNTGPGVWYDTGDYIPTAGHTFTNAIGATAAFSVSGTGTEGGGTTDKTSSDSGQGAEAAGSANASFSRMESGSGVDGPASVMANILAGDSGSAVESATTAAPENLLASDSGAGADVITGMTAAYTRSESGAGAEVSAWTASFAAGDAGQATEYTHILGLWEVLFSGDAGGGSDSLKGLAVTGGHDTGLRAGPGRVGIPHKEVKL
jgi:hypothetical protein